MIFNEKKYDYKVDESWREKCWEKEDFKRLKDLIHKYNGEAYTGEHRYHGNRVVIFHVRINPKDSYENVVSMLCEIGNFEYTFYKGVDYKVHPITLEQHHLNRYYKDFKKIYKLDGCDRFYIVSTGENDYLISHEQYNIKKAEI